MPKPLVTINSRKYDMSIRRTWTCELVERHGQQLVFVGEFEHHVEHAGLGSIRRGTISYEYYWLDRWYNVFRFHEPDGSLRNFYCNVAMPAIYANDVLDYVDLDIDVVVWQDYTLEILDREDFEANSIIYQYPPRIRSKVDRSLMELLTLVGNRGFPFDTGL